MVVYALQNWLNLLSLRMKCLSVTYQKKTVPCFYRTVLSFIFSTSPWYLVPRKGFRRPAFAPML